VPPQAFLRGHDGIKEETPHIFSQKHWRNVGEMDQDIKKTLLESETLLGESYASALDKYAQFVTLLPGEVIVAVYPASKQNRLRRNILSVFSCGLYYVIWKFLWWHKHGALIVTNGRIIQVSCCVGRRHYSVKVDTFIVDDSLLSATIHVPHPLPCTFRHGVSKVRIATRLGELMVKMPKTHWFKDCMVKMWQTLSMVNSSQMKTLKSLHGKADFNAEQRWHHITVNALNRLHFHILWAPLIHADGEETDFSGTSCSSSSDSESSKERSKHREKQDFCELRQLAPKPKQRVFARNYDMQGAHYKIFHDLGSFHPKYNFPRTTGHGFHSHCWLQFPENYRAPLIIDVSEAAVIVIALWIPKNRFQKLDVAELQNDDPRRMDTANSLATTNPNEDEQDDLPMEPQFSDGDMDAIASRSNRFKEFLWAKTKSAQTRFSSTSSSWTPADSTNSNSTINHGTSSMAIRAMHAVTNCFNTAFTEEEHVWPAGIAAGWKEMGPEWKNPSLGYHNYSHHTHDSVCYHMQVDGPKIITIPGRPYAATLFGGPYLWDIDVEIGNEMETFTFPRQQDEEVLWKSQLEHERPDFLWMKIPVPALVQEWRISSRRIIAVRTEPLPNMARRIRKIALCLASPPKQTLHFIPLNTIVGFVAEEVFSIEYSTINKIRRKFCGRNPEDKTCVSLKLLTKYGARRQFPEGAALSQMIYLEPSDGMAIRRDEQVNSALYDPILQELRHWGTAFKLAFNDNYSRPIHLVPARNGHVEGCGRGWQPKIKSRFHAIAEHVHREIHKHKRTTGILEILGATHAHGHHRHSRRLQSMHADYFEKNKHLLGRASVDGRASMGMDTISPRGYGSEESPCDYGSEASEDSPSRFQLGAVGAEGDAAKGEGKGTFKGILKRPGKKTAEAPVDSTKFCETGEDCAQADFLLPDVGPED
jgi:hypothetical protein